MSFTSRNGNTIIECGYDYQGRRYMKKVTQNGTVASHERYLYRGYLQIAAQDMLDNRNVLRTLLWDPLEPVATRPLALAQDASLYCYGMDFNKNVTEVFDAQGNVAAAYDYSPYGTATRTGRLVQPVQWSAEMHDDDLALVYYNYRYYNPRDGRWINRDPIAEKGGWNLYAFLGNSTQDKFDTFGLQALDSLSNTVIQGLAAGKISEVATLLGYSTTAALVAALIEGGYKLKCKACNPPVGSQRQQCHRNHTHNGWNPHYHIFTVNQSPIVAGCRCFDKRTILNIQVDLLEEELKSSNKKIMANYFSGEEIKVGDFITTDNGHDKNKVIKLIDNTYLMQSYGLDCFGALLSSSSAKGMIFVSFKELSSQDTKFIKRKTI